MAMMQVDVRPQDPPATAEQAMEFIVTLKEQLAATIKEHEETAAKAQEARTSARQLRADLDSRAISRSREGWVQSEEQVASELAWKERDLALRRSGLEHSIQQLEHDWGGEIAIVEEARRESEEAFGERIGQREARLAEIEASLSTASSVELQVLVEEQSKLRGQLADLREQKADLEQVARHRAFERAVEEALGAVKRRVNRTRSRLLAEVEGRDISVVNPEEAARRTLVSNRVRSDPWEVINAVLWELKLPARVEGEVIRRLTPLGVDWQREWRKEDAEPNA